MKRLSFITQFRIEFLLLPTGCRKVLGKMPEKGGESKKGELFEKGEINTLCKLLWVQKL